MKKLLVASMNEGKIREIRKLLSESDFKLISLKDINFREKIEESGKTFRENAVIKAETAGRKTGYLTVAEDSGLEVDYLGGKPGIYSARYGLGTDEDRCRKILVELDGADREKRTARFIAVLALYDPGKRKTAVFEGKSEGYITRECAGKNGFGYDPIFFNIELGKTNARATISEKNRVSHRARAFAKLVEYLKSGNHTSGD